MERTLVLVKPDGIQRRIVGEIISRFERRGMRIVGLKLMQIDEGLARLHYAAHEGKPFFNGLISYITSGPVVAMAIEGERAIETTRSLMGDTDPAKAKPGTIRADFAMDIQRNLIHGSDSPESAERELALFFEKNELLSYERTIDRWIFSDNR